MPAAPPHDCPEISELEPFINGELSGEAWKRIDDHLSSCSVCQGIVSEITANLRLASALRSAGSLAFRAEGPPSVHQGDQASTRSAQPDCIDDFYIIREIGRGGMGVVYEAQQTRPHRRVALKVLHALYAHERHDRIFQREVQALARLRHSAIASIHTAGQTSDGRPYLVMELAAGIKLGEWLRATDVTLAQKLDLFRQLCDAIAYAHQRGVIHRDLKPSNILIDDQGRPKVLDFGLAKLVEIEDDQSVYASAVTEIGRVQGTLPYMSPEQARGDVHEVDVRSDVYSLGVILYEMLTGTLPYDADWSRLPGAVRTICETPPKRPSLLDRALRGDLETIILKSLEKEPDRRYRGAAALGDDIDRFIKNQPITARPPSRAYQVRKFAQRNKVLVAGAVTCVVLLAAAVVGTTLGMMRAANAAHVAKSEAAKATRVAEFMQVVLGSADLARGKGPDYTVREALSDAQQWVRDDLEGEPHVEAVVQHMIGNAYLNLGLYRESLDHLRRAVELLDVSGPTGGPDHVRMLQSRSRALARLRQFDDADEDLQRAMAFARQIGDDSVEVAVTLVGRGRLASDRNDAATAEQSYRDALAIFERRTGPDSEKSISCLRNLASVLSVRGQLQESEELYREAIRRHERTPRSNRLPHANALNGLATVLMDLRRFDEAIELYEQALAVRRETLGDRHRDVATVLNNLGLALSNVRQLDRAEAMLNEALSIRRAILPQDHPDILVTMNNMVTVYHHRQDFTSAEAMCRQVLEARRRVQPESGAVATSLNNLAVILRAQDRPEEAEPCIREAVAITRRRLGEDHPDVSHSLATLGSVLIDLEKWDQAEEALRESHRIAVLKYPPRHARTASIQASLGTCLAHLRRFEEADQLLIEAYEVLRDNVGERDARTIDALRRLVECCRMSNRDAQAEEYLVKLNAARGSTP